MFYEAPHKLVRTLGDMLEVFGNRRIALARELTKKFEEVIRCNIEDALKLYADRPPKGEYVLVVEGEDEGQAGEESRKSWDGLGLEEHLDMYLKEGLKKMEAIKKVAKERGLAKRDVYASLHKPQD